MNKKVTYLKCKPTQKEIELIKVILKAVSQDDKEKMTNVLISHIKQKYGGLKIEDL